MFKGQVEHPGRKLSGNVDDPVYVAINPDGVFIIDMDDVVSGLTNPQESRSRMIATKPDSIMCCRSSCLVCCMRT